MKTTKSAQAALHKRFIGEINGQGYVNTPQENLVEGVRLDQFEQDLKQGDGNELRTKFCAVHSSSALAVNCFAIFKDRPEDIVLLGHRGAAGIKFEQQLKIFAESKPANLDVWVDQGARAVAIESKLLEYFELKKPVFSPAYASLAEGSEPPWRNAYSDAKLGTPQHLDRAQLVKHYFGLRRLQTSSSPPQDLTLLYLFWEPLNWQDVQECRAHRREVELFAEQVAGASIPFRWMPYSELWKDWMELPELRDHTLRLKARYETCI